MAKRYGDVVAVDGVDFELADGEFFSMLGPSGSGKTTTSRMIAGFEAPTSGTVELEGEDVSHRPPYDRGVNTLFQDDALFPHMSVGRNVGYGLLVKRVGRAERRERVAAALAGVRRSGFDDRKPGQLTLTSIGVHRFRFFGRDAISLLVVLPIALPGIVTGVALNASFTQILGVSLALWTIVVAHATFCIVVARLRRTSRSLEAASADLGGDPWQTFRYVAFPLLRSAPLAGGLLAFALSFDEIVVTNFTAGGQVTVPIWIFSNLFRPANAPLVSVAALMVVLLPVIPVWFAQRLAGEAGAATGGAR